MPRQTFISREFFVNASEAQTRENLLQLPGAVSNIKLVAENPRLHCVVFAYEQNEQRFNQVAVSLLPLNDSHTQVTLHGSNANGAPFYNDPFVNNAVQNFESAIQASVKGKLASFEPVQPRVRMRHKMFGVAALLLTCIGALFIWRKL